MVDEMASCSNDSVSNILDYAQTFSRQTKQSYATCYIFTTLLLAHLKKLSQIIESATEKLLQFILPLK